MVPKTVQIGALMRNKDHTIHEDVGLKYCMYDKRFVVWSVVAPLEVYRI
jgi:hypothetical protein